MKKVKFVSSSEVFWSIFVRREPFRLSVCPYMFSHCLLLLQNHWDDFNQTWPKTTLGERGIVFFGFFYMKGHAFFKGIQFVFIDTLFLLFKESSSQKPLNQKSCILCRNILRWYRFTFVHIMIPVGSVEVSTFYTGICWEILFYNIFLSKRLAKNAVTCVGWYRFKCVKIMIPVGWMGSQERGVKYLDRNILKKWTIHISKTTCPVKL